MLGKKPKKIYKTELKTISKTTPEELDKAVTNWMKENNRYQRQPPEHDPGHLGR